MSSPAQFNQYTVPVEASWEPDLWGRVRSSVRVQAYTAQERAADLENVRLAMHAQLAQDYFELRSQNSLKQVLDASVTTDGETLQITKQLYGAGLATDEAVSAAEAQLSSTRAQQEDTGVLIAQYQHAIAILLGQPPAELKLKTGALDFTIPSVPVGLPSDLLQRRPDIASAERAVAAANSQIGIARSAYYPYLTLNAAVGYSTTNVLDWFAWPSRVWAVGPSIAETVFDAGLRKATVQEARARYDATVASYRQTTLTAFGQVEDSIASLRQLQSAISAQEQAVAAAQRTLDEATVRYKSGLDPYLNVTTAQMNLLAYEQADVTLRSEQVIACVQLIQALGGGWDTGQMPSAKAVTHAR